MGVRQEAKCDQEEMVKRFYSIKAMAVWACKRLVKSVQFGEHRQRKWHKPRWYQFNLDRYFDVQQEAFMGAMRACELYDPSKGARLTTYAMWHIIQKVRRFLGHEWFECNYVPVWKPASIPNTWSQMDHDHYWEDRFSAVEDKIDSGRLFFALSDRPKLQQILSLRYGMDEGRGYERTLQEVADMFNVTRERIRQIVSKAEFILKRRIRENQKPWCVA